MREGLRRARGRVKMAMGQIANRVPLSTEFGFDRGTPIDRYYVEAFLAANAKDVRGRVLEIGDDSYSRQFGGDRISRQDVLHVDPGHPGATIIGDLCDPTVLPTGAFDCMILTQTLHLIFDMREVVTQIRRALRPSGVALITVPGITPVDRGEWGSSWYWSLTGPALERLLATGFDPKKLGLEVYGNLFSATAFLHGAALEEVSRAKLDPYDAAYPVIVAARAEA